MEIIRLAGYTEDEKLNIAMRYLVPKQMKANGLKASEIEISEAAVRDIIQFYTREAGVRSLDREISKVCRKVVKDLLVGLEGKTKKLKTTKRVEITSGNLETYLGVKRFDFGLAAKENQVGQVTGLAWTQVGGDLLTIESVAMPGKGKTITTGKLGDVMQESIQAAMSVVRSRANRLGIPEDFYEKNDIHIHFPEGATPKDGPSAGIGITTALVSVLTNIPVRADVAMTGEITLRGEVLPIGGLKEKLLAAHRGGIKTVLIPDQNVKDLAEIPENVKDCLDIRPVKWIEEVLESALERMPQAVVAEIPVADVAKETKEVEVAAITKH
jgi:ATP-dependent Lon protease